MTAFYMKMENVTPYQLHVRRLSDATCIRTFSSPTGHHGRQMVTGHLRHLTSLPIGRYDISRGSKSPSATSMTLLSIGRKDIHVVRSHQVIQA